MSVNDDMLNSALTLLRFLMPIFELGIWVERKG